MHVSAGGVVHLASMKVPPKRKGNLHTRPPHPLDYSIASMKVPPKRKGNASGAASRVGQAVRLNESPSEKEGKSRNPLMRTWVFTGLNESPSEKEGKWMPRALWAPRLGAPQ